MEEDPEEHLLSSVCQILICKIIYRSCVFLYMTWEERGGFMSRGAYILEIWKFLILYTVSLPPFGRFPHQGKCSLKI